MEIAVYGALGRMGQRVVALAKEAGWKPAHLWERPDHPQLGQAYEGRLTSLPSEKVNVQGVIDFSSPEAFDAILDWCEKYGVPLVSGTTGLSEAQKERVREVGEKIPLLYATNMSLGIALLRKLVREAAKVLGEDFDVELVEAHHRHKKDAPSGTCYTLLEDVASALGRDPNQVARFGRQGHTGERSSSEIGVHVLRMGGVIGKHWVCFASPDEGLELVHWAESRDVFAKGALRALQWLVSQPAGLYSMEHLVF